MAPVLQITLQEVTAYKEKTKKSRDPSSSAKLIEESCSKFAGSRDNPSLPAAGIFTCRFSITTSADASLMYINEIKVVSRQVV